MEEKIVKYLKVIIITGVFVYIFVNAFITFKKGYNTDDLMDAFISETFTNEKIDEMFDNININNKIYFENDTLDVNDMLMNDKLAIASKHVSFIELTSNNSHYGKYYYMLESDDLKRQYIHIFDDEYDNMNFVNGNISWNYVDGNYYSSDYHNDNELEKIKYVIKDKNIESNKLNIEIIPYILKDNSIYDMNGNLVLENSDSLNINNYELDHYVFTFINKNEELLFKCVNKIKIS